MSTFNIHTSLILETYELIANFIISKRCTGRYRDTREDQVDQERNGGVQSTETYERWGSPGRKQRWQLLTDTDGIGVWPNVSSRMRDESRSKIKEHNIYNADVYLGLLIEPLHIGNTCH